MSDTLPKGPRGSKTASIVHLAVGRALTEWEHVETNMAKIFGHLCSDGLHRSTEAAERAYGSVTSGRGRNDMLAQAVLEASLYWSDLAADLSQLIKDHGSLGGTRNDIAHGMTCHFTETVQEVEHDMGHFLIAPPYNSRKNFSASDPKFWDQPILERHKYKYAAGQIDGFRKQFLDLKQRSFGIHVEMFRRGIKRRLDEPSG